MQVKAVEAEVMSSAPEPEAELGTGSTPVADEWHDDVAALGAREKFERHVDGRVGGVEGSDDLADDLAVQNARFSMMSSWLQHSTHAPAPPSDAFDDSAASGEEYADLDLFGDDTEEDLQRLEAVAAAARERNAAVVAAAPPVGERTAAEARRVYMLDSVKRRQVVTSPAVFTKDECTALVEVVEEAVCRRGGWETERHGAYPTTDIAVGALPPAMAKRVVADVNERVITPAALARGFGPGHLACRDLFFVKYEAASGAQAGLARHTDGSVLSFNVLLNDPVEFDGGGTYFTHLGRAESTGQGGCVLHDGKLEHAGVPITRGKRMLMVGFVETTDHELPDLLDASGGQGVQRMGVTK